MESKPNMKDLTSLNTQLSKGVLEMKFMKKSKESALKQLQAEESRRLYSEEITEGMKKTGSIVFVETSISNCKDLIEGRLSFLGANPEIEKMMANEFADKLNEIDTNKGKDVSDMEMANNLSSSLQKKYPNKMKKKFLKPSSNI